MYIQIFIVNKYDRVVKKILKNKFSIPQFINMNRSWFFNKANSSTNLRGFCDD